MNGIYPSIYNAFDIYIYIYIYGPKWNMNVMWNIYVNFTGVYSRGYQVGEFTIFTCDLFMWILGCSIT